MDSINKTNIRTLKLGVEKEISSLEKFSDCQFLGVEDQIILWKSKERGYFYTDLEYRPLFHTSFSYATPFSDGQAIVYYQHVPCILNIRDLTITSIPPQINYKNCRSNIVHGNLASFCWEKGKWGSYVLCDDTFYEDVPFLWDRLEFSRYPNFAYGGNHTSVYPEIHIDICFSWTPQYGTFISANNISEYKRLCKMEEPNEFRNCSTSVYRFHKMYFSNEEKFQKMCSLNPIFYSQAFVPGTIYNPRNDFSQSFKKVLSTPVDLRDSYFQEDLNCDFGYDYFTDIDPNLDHYQYVRGIYLEKN